MNVWISFLADGKSERGATHRRRVAQVDHAIPLPWNRLPLSRVV